MARGQAARMKEELVDSSLRVVVVTGDTQQEGLRSGHVRRGCRHVSEEAEMEEVVRLAPQPFDLRSGVERRVSERAVVHFADRVRTLSPTRRRRHGVRSACAPTTGRSQCESAERHGESDGAHPASLPRAFGYARAMATTATQTFKNFIGGEWVDAASGETFESTSPANGETIGVFPRSGAEDVDRAVAVAKEAFADWRLVPAPKRGEILFRLARLLEQEKPALTHLMTREMGKVKAEAGGDVQEAIDITYYMAGEGRRLFGHTTPSELRDKWNMSVRQPIGVVGAITPWNFPVAIPSWKLIPALVCGNTVVLKPATDTPALAERFVELLAESGIPSGVVNIVHGGGGTVGDRLVRHPDVRVITLTGSRETGVEVLKAAAETLTHVHLELGGKNAIVVLDDADLELAVDGILWSAFGTSGQRCTAASRVIVQRGAYDELQSRLVERVEKLRLGPGWEDDTDIGPVINRTALDKIHSYTGIGKDEGAKLLTGGEIAGDGDLGRGFFYRPTIFADVDPQMRIAQEEIFGPTTALIPVADLDEAIRVSNGIKFGLSSSIFTQDVNAAFRAMRDLEAGITYVNAGTIGAEVHLPFGGTKDTGNGHREAGQAALDVFTEWKSIYVDYSGRLQRAQIDTEP
jgi:alpha-ketoglutaric semialdehyde dehydrogenase